jgi:hypothetical protein
MLIETKEKRMNKRFDPKPVNEMLMGKYKGKTFEEIFEADPDYLKWYRDTTDPADMKNNGKYAKQNQARIKYINELFAEGSEERIGVKPETKPTPKENKTTIVPSSVLENMLKILLVLEEKIDQLIGKTENIDKDQQVDEVPNDDMIT